MNLSFLTKLAHYRWNIAIIAELHCSNGAKFVTLANRLAVSRSTLTRCLEALINLGLVRRNPGYGHPLRPEYLLTARGARCGLACRKLTQRLRTCGEEQIGFNKWSLPLVAAIGIDSRRFGELKDRLDDITPRALALTLKELESQGWLRRGVTGDYPPRTEYRLERAGHAVLRILQNLT